MPHTQSPYYLCPDKLYPAHVPGQPLIYATVEVITSTERVQICKHTRGQGLDEFADGEVCDQAYDEWEAYLKTCGLVIMPLIERPGACILLDLTDAVDGGGSALGVLLKYPGTNSQFNPATGCYQALVDCENTVAQVFHMDVLSFLVPVGAVLYLKLDSYVPSKRGRFVAVRLNVPNVSTPVQGKLYVSALRRNARERNGSGNQGRGSITMEVNPWDLIPEREWKSDHSLLDKWL